MTDEFDLSEDDYFAIFFDRDLMTRMYREYHQYPEIDIKQDEDDSRIRRTTVAIPKMEMPAAVAKLLGSNFRYTEEAVFDKKSKVMTFKTTPSIMADKVKNEGSVRIEVLGPNRIRRMVDVLLNVKVFGVGGLVESAFEKTIRDGWRKGTEFIKREKQR
jgi:hypothetical protein